ncbi:DNA repair protein SWI5 homolog [Rhipicephalus sanguineus]|uniref:DNA repair protein SWI5 homolog n=1 Tax=Rhipicephalus sanguineus TaxID=34632 RepID=UPI001893D45C|nr:DNA repair protein SWI5 homolog [Rhipicephalus sanguineus]
MAASETPTRNRFKMQARRSRPSLSGAHRPFCSPMKAAPVSSESVQDLQKKLAGLRKRSHLLDEEIEQLKAEGCTIEELPWHMEQLHTYNRIKDVAHQVIGSLAVLEGVTIKDKQEHYGLPTTEPTSVPPHT